MNYTRVLKALRLALLFSSFMPYCFAAEKEHPEKRKFEDMISSSLKKIKYQNSSEQSTVRPEYKVSDLHAAARQGNTPHILHYLRLGYNREAQDHNGARCLHLAAAHGHLDAVRLLLAVGADREAKNNTGLTPLHLAVYNGHSAIVQCLLKAGAYKDARMNEGKTPLHLAAHNGDLDLTIMLLREGAAINAAGTDGFSAIYGTVKKALEGEEKQRKVFDYLLEAGVDCSSKKGMQSLTYKLLFHRSRDSIGFLAEEPALYMLKKILAEGIDLPVSHPPICDALRTVRLRKDVPALAAIETELRRRREELDPAERAEAMTTMIRDACDLDEQGLARYVQQSAQSSRDARLLKAAKKE